MKKLTVLNVLIFFVALSLQAESDYYSQALANIDKGNIEQSIEQLQMHLRLYPDDSDAYFTMAMALNRLNEYQQSADMLKKSLQLNPGQMSTYFALAMVSEKLQKYQEALDYWHKFTLFTKNKKLLKVAEKHINLLEQLK